MSQRSSFPHVCAIGRSFRIYVASRGFPWIPDSVPVVVPTPKTTEAVASRGFAWLPEPVSVVVPSPKVTESVASHSFPSLSLGSCQLQCYQSLGFRWFLEPVSVVVPSPNDDSVPHQLLGTFGYKAAAYKHAYLAKKYLAQKLPPVVLSSSF